MLSSWQHCHRTNGPDGAFKGAGFEEGCVRLIGMQAGEEAVSGAVISKDVGFLNWQTHFDSVC